MPGLVAGIHRIAKEMDCWVKPGQARQRRLRRGHRQANAPPPRGFEDSGGGIAGRLVRIPSPSWTSRKVRGGAGHRGSGMRRQACAGPADRDASRHRGSPERDRDAPDGRRAASPPVPPASRARCWRLAPRRPWRIHLLSSTGADRVGSTDGHGLGRPLPRHATRPSRRRGAIWRATAPASRCPRPAPKPAEAASGPGTSAVSVRVRVMTYALGLKQGEGNIVI